MKPCYCLIVSILLFTIACKKPLRITESQTHNLNFVAESSKSTGGQWDATFYGGAGTTDGGSVAAGLRTVATPQFNFDGSIVKLDTTGNKVWEKTIGGNSDDQLGDVKELADGSFIGVGYSRSNDGDIPTNQGGMDVLIVKLDRNGGKVWVKTIGSPQNEFARSVMINSDGTCLIVGFKGVTRNNVLSNDGWLCKMDQNGNVLWERTYGGTQTDNITSIIESGDGGFVFVGASNSTDGDLMGNAVGGTNFWIGKLDASGNELWHKTYGGSQSDGAQNVVKSGEGFLVIGTSASNDGDVTGGHGGADAWAIKIDGSGNKIWQKTIGGTGTEFARAMARSHDDAILIGISARSADGDFPINKGVSDCWLVKIDNDGNNLGQHRLGGSWADEPYVITNAANNSYFLLGWSSSDDADISGFNGTNGSPESAWALKFTDRP